MILYEMVHSSFLYLQPFLLSRLPDSKSNPRILHLGLGESTLTADLANLRYTNQLSFGFSDVVIQQMQAKHPEF